MGLRRFAGLLRPFVREFGRRFDILTKADGATWLRSVSFTNSLTDIRLIWCGLVPRLPGFHGNHIKTVNQGSHPGHLGVLGCEKRIREKTVGTITPALQCALADSWTCRSNSFLEQRRTILDSDWLPAVTIGVQTHGCRKSTITRCEEFPNSDASVVIKSRYLLGTCVYCAIKFE